MAAPRKKSGEQTVTGAARKRAVLYTRVSSAEQEREGFSIPAQQKLLREYAIEHEIGVAAEHVDIETAKRTGRKGFDAMLRYLKSHPSVQIILVEKTDRLYRNLKDWVTLDSLDVEIHFVKENVVLSKDSRSSEKFMHGIKVLMAKNYIDNLSEETRKGMLQKAEEGIWPSCAPLGYTNLLGPNGKKIIAIDPSLGAAVTQLFEWFETGRYSIKELTQKARTTGLRYRKSGKPVGGSTINSILRNRLYTGSFEWLGKIYEGSHAPLTTYATWMNCQEILDGRSISNLHGNRHQFAFTGLLTCGHCGCAVTAEIKKGRYIYYHCSRFKARCPERYVREEVLAEKFAAVLKRLRVDDLAFNLIRRALRETAANERQDRDERIGKLRAEVDRLQHRLDTLYVDKMDGRVTGEFHDRLSRQWREERQRCIHDMESLAHAEDDLIDDGIALLDIARTAHEGFIRQPLAIKQRALNLLLSNAKYANGEIVAQFRQPFDLLEEFPGDGGGSSTPFHPSNSQKKNWLSKSLTHKTILRLASDETRKTYSRYKAWKRVSRFAEAGGMAVFAHDAPRAPERPPTNGVRKRDRDRRERIRLAGGPKPTLRERAVALAREKGEVRTKDLTDIGVHRCYLGKMCGEGLLVKVGYGRYRASAAEGES